MPASSKTPSRKSSPSTSQPFELRPSSIQGQGAFALRPIKEGERIIEYLGERITQDQADERYDDGAMSRHHTFLFSVDEDTVIDAARNGNDARFINHSCAPNCQAFLEEDRIFIYALRDLAPGEELVYDYGYERTEGMGPDEEALYVCRCGAPECRGTILAPVKKKDASARKATQKKKRSSTKKKSSSATKSKTGAKQASKTGAKQAPKKASKKASKTSPKRGARG